jgi:hypothetical protein
MVDHLCIKHALLGPRQFHAGLSISHLRVHPFPFTLWESKHGPGKNRGYSQGPLYR